MKKYFAFLLLLSFSVQAQEKIKWPYRKKAVIVLTYDDALESQLDNAVPQLEAAGLKATFFLTGDISDSQLLRWRRLAKKGYELANHTLFHPCDSTDDNPVSSANYTIPRILGEIEAMNHLLFAIDGRSGRTYAYPCTETEVGGKDYVDSLRKSGLIKYARTGGDTDAVITDFRHFDPLLVPSYGLDPNTSGKQLISFVQKAEEHGGMAVIMLHGVGGDYISTSIQAHQELVNYLKKHKKEIWIPTFRQAMDYVMQYKNLNK